MIDCQSWITIMFFWLKITQSSLTTEEETTEGFCLSHKHLCLCSQRTKNPFCAPPPRESLIQLVDLLSSHSTSYDTNWNCFLMASIAFLWVAPIRTSVFALPSHHFYLTSCFLSSVVLGQTQQNNLGRVCSKDFLEKYHWLNDFPYS